ncbi:MAG: MFS transporter [Verrucomicrobiota bacterium]
MHEDKTLTKLTYRYDLIRGAFGGIVEVGALSFGLLAAIRYFEAPDTVKGVLSAGIAFGLFLAPFGQKIAAWSTLPASRAASLCFLGSAAGYALASQVESLWLFTVAFLGANALLAQVPSLLVAVYAKNYSHQDRGRLVSNTFIVAAVVGALLSFLGSEYLDFHPRAFGVLFLVMAGASLVSGFAVARIPSDPLPLPEPKKWGSFSLIRDDRVFAKMLLAWMILGLANLALLPLRVEVLANPIYGFDLRNSEVIFITVVVFAIARILGLKVFGYIFERMNFLIYRTLINLFLFLAILLYFNSSNLWIIGLGSALFGLAMGGGNLAWNLWVTRIAPDDKVTEYMSVHMSLTGVRGIAAPIIGYSLLPIIPLSVLSWISLALLSYSGWLFLQLWLREPVRNQFKGRHY